MIKKIIRKILGREKKAPPLSHPAVLQRKEHGIDPRLLSSNAARVIHILEKAGYEAYIVGGAVRDLLLGIQPKDFDVATNATPEQVRRLFRRAFLIGRRFQIVHVMFGHDLIEVTTFRGTTSASAIKDEAGRLLRDNTFGTQQEDALRRDFTVNAMYYNPTHQTLHDFHGGTGDLKKRVLRIIGDPAERFREDPVRMLRIVRFAAKLDFTIDPDTRKPIPLLAPLINNVPSARLFDEMLKLLMSGHAMACLQELRHQGLHHGLLPLLDVVLEQPKGARFVELALGRTDQRIREEKPVSPGFIFAALLWTQVSEKWEQYRSRGEYPIPALHSAANDIFETQTEKLALQRRIISDMRDIWALQPRLERRTGRTAYKLIEHDRFRAAYDFLLLRCEAGEIDPEIGEWWTRFINADGPTREELLKIKFNSASEPAKRKRKRGGTRRRQKPASSNTPGSIEPAA
ncbi:polynucleotide adenylyltransferase PcnB [Oxalobacter vibrioformis]|uniref:Poly(A) polymerase I n=1 Tax=Oxalobacter vibrioformis TaxID=933080 RepID=A0A9E9M0G7_9BURK|nr:polynucleotide adenylyltransferase PcnB [Oxalobacter vibrioformis]WAW10975.1 polynucleotide adenylyltransferase PcnB [Oxalobacter vibrioformis]